MISGIISRKALYREPAIIFPTYDPLPTDLPTPADISYWMAASQAYADTGMTVQALDGQTIAAIQNAGAYAQDLIQTNPVNRPTFHDGGVNDQPYIECDAVGLPKFFENLLGISMAGGITVTSRYTNFWVFEAVDLSLSSAPLLAPQNNSTMGKIGNYIKAGGATANACWYKNEVLKQLDNPLTDLNIFMMQNTNGGAGSFAWASGDTDRTTFSQTTNMSTGATGAEFLRHSALGRRFVGRLYEFIRYDRSLSAAECLVVLDYLRTKYIP